MDALLRGLATLVAATMMGLIFMPVPGSEAHTTGFPVIRFNPFRLPWAADGGWEVGGGYTPGSSPGHTGFEIDFSSLPDGSSNYQHPVKSAGGGLLEYRDAGENTGLGLHAVVHHNEGWYSVYGHLCATGAAAGDIAQGTWLGDVGDTGYVEPPVPEPCESSAAAHLHFEVHEPSGATANATLSGVTIEHLAADTDQSHQSDNAGAGYIGYRTRDDAFHARALMPDVSPASTRKGKFTTCDAAETHYLYTCPYYAFTVRGQDFVGPRMPGNTYHETFSLVQAPGGEVVKVKGLIQKAYQSRVTRGGPRVSSYLGRPLGEEGLLNGSRFMNFQNGTIIVGQWSSGAPLRWYVRVLAGDGSTLLERTLTDPAGAGDCASVNGDVFVNIIDMQQVASHVGYDGDASYDRLYDFWHGGGFAGYADGSITVLDVYAVNLRQGTCPPEV